MVPGDALAEIETDNAASMTFECTDEMVIEILVSQGDEVNVGDPIMVTVEEGDISKAFSDFVAPTRAGAPDAPPVPAAPSSTSTPCCSWSGSTTRNNTHTGRDSSSCSR